MNPTTRPRVIADDDTVVEFVMANCDPGNEIETIWDGIWRPTSPRRRGVAASEIRDRASRPEARGPGVGRITALWDQAPDGPGQFCLKLGFRPVGELFGETVGELDV